MSMTDPIADYLTRIRNALMVNHEAVEIPSSKAKVAITKILKDEGFIEDYMVLDDRKQGLIRVDLKYHKGRTPVIEKMVRVSRPGRRIYSGAEDIPRVLGGLGVAIISTSKGIITDKAARELRVGGEVLCTVY
jgi:small subunit ribosomal protein S8